MRAQVEGRPDRLLTREPVAERRGADAAGFFALDVAEEARRALRRASTTGRPLGASAWIKALEKATGRDLTPGPAGRPSKLFGAEGVSVPN